MFFFSFLVSYLNCVNVSLRVNEKTYYLNNPTTTKLRLIIGYLRLRQINCLNLHCSMCTAGTDLKKYN